jgi:hypothetical protein
MKFESLADEVEFRMVLEEGGGTQFLRNNFSESQRFLMSVRNPSQGLRENPPPRSLRGSDSGLHQLWDRGKNDGYDDLPVISEDELRALASERVNSKTSRHGGVDEEEALLNDVYRRGRAYGALVKKRGSEEAALAWRKEEAKSYGRDSGQADAVNTPKDYISGPLIADTLRNAGFDLVPHETIKEAYRLGWGMPLRREAVSSESPGAAAGTGSSSVARAASASAGPSGAAQSENPPAYLLGAPPARSAGRAR